AEDGIRDRNVTGVQTCALPISLLKRHWNDFPCIGSASVPNRRQDLRTGLIESRAENPEWCRRLCFQRWCCGTDVWSDDTARSGEIGRASCRERGYISGVAVALS